ncbi:uncharacterized protein PAF06_009687 [Gastrophryne carolinensis]
MGTTCAPSYANLYLGGWERGLWAEDKLSRYLCHVATWHRYIDDIILIWTDTQNNLEKFVSELNTNDLNLKFTLKFSQSAINFLDLTVMLSQEGLVTTKFYRKPSAAIMMLQASSAHAKPLLKSIPYMYSLENQRSISALVQTCEDFGRASGAKVNCGKSEAMLFGKWQLSSPVPFNVKPDYIKILGVWFGKEGAALKSWDERIAKMNQKFGLWSLRKLSIEGKALVLRSEILPVLQYLAQAWPPRAKPRKTIAKAVFYFIWGSKMDRVKRTKLCKEPRKGGKGVPDIPTMLMVAFASTCVQRTARNSEPASAGHAMSRFFLLRVWRKFGWAKWDSSVPYAWNLPWFYKDVEDFILEQQLAGVKADLWKPKTVYRLIRAKDKTEPILGLPLDTCRFVWKNVSSRRLSNQHKDLAWQAIQGGLPIRTFMHDRGLSRYRHCPLFVVCEETSRHLFWDCSYAQALLDALGSELKDCGVPRNAVTHCGVLYGLFHGNFAEEEVERAWRVMNCFKDAIWCARNRFILSLLRDYSLMDFGVEEEEDD